MALRFVYFILYYLLVMVVVRYVLFKHSSCPTNIFRFSQRLTGLHKLDGYVLRVVISLLDRGKEKRRNYHDLN